MRRFRARMTFHLVWLLGAVAMWTVAIWAFARAAPNVVRILPLLALVFLAIVGMTARRALRRMARPVEVLTEASRRFGAGDLKYRVPEPWHAFGRDEEHQRRFARHWKRRHEHGHHGHGGPLDELVALGVAWNEMAERIERLVGGQRELLANVSHELRSPLARLRVALELIPRDADGEARIAAAVSDIEELDRLIDDVLTTARLDGAATPARREPVDSAALFDGVVTRAGHDPQTAACRVVVAPGAPGGLGLRGDAALLRRALWNLVENAARYGAAPITLAAERQGDRVLLSVSDEGPGIAAADRARLVMPFVRGDAARTPAVESGRRGVGLGLTIASRVAEVHGGSLELAPAHADPERGLRVSLNLPASSID